MKFNLRANRSRFGLRIRAKRLVRLENVLKTVKLQLSMKPGTKEKINFGVWGLVFGAVIAMIIGFIWGGWSTFTTTQKISEEAVVASLAAICVAQFMNDPNHEEKLKKFAETATYSRDGFIKDGGWDKMPGQEEASYGVAQACSDGIELLIKK